LGVTLGSQEWLELLGGILDDVVARRGEEGRKFSVCEVFLNAPDGLIGGKPRTAAWHFTVDGKTAKAAAGEVDWADCKVFLDYERTLPFARAVITGKDDPELPVLGREGDARNLPGYLMEIHNIAAAHTD
jgi:hypothetical protein